MLDIQVQAVPNLNKKREFLISVNGVVLLLCGKNEVASVVSVIEKGEIDKGFTTLSPAKQGKVIKLLKAKLNQNKG